MEIITQRNHEKSPAGAEIGLQSVSAAEIHSVPGRSARREGNGGEVKRAVRSDRAGMGRKHVGKRPREKISAAVFCAKMALAIPVGGAYNRLVREHEKGSEMRRDERSFWSKLSSPDIAAHLLRKVDFSACASVCLSPDGRRKKRNAAGIFFCPGRFRERRESDAYHSQNC